MTDIQRSSENGVVEVMDFFRKLSQQELDAATQARLTEEAQRDFDAVSVEARQKFYQKKDEPTPAFSAEELAKSKEAHVQGRLQAAVRRQRNLLTFQEFSSQAQCDEALKMLDALKTEHVNFIEARVGIDATQLEKKITNQAATAEALTTALKSLPAEAEGTEETRNSLEKQIHNHGILKARFEKELAEVLSLPSLRLEIGEIHDFEAGLKTVMEMMKKEDTRIARFHSEYGRLGLLQTDLTLDKSFRFGENGSFELEMMRQTMLGKIAKKLRSRVKGIMKIHEEPLSKDGNGKADSSLQKKVEHFFSHQLTEGLDTPLSTRQTLAVGEIEQEAAADELPAAGEIVAAPATESLVIEPEAEIPTLVAEPSKEFVPTATTALLPPGGPIEVQVPKLAPLSSVATIRDFSRQVAMSPTLTAPAPANGQTIPMPFGVVEEEAAEPGVAKKHDVLDPNVSFAQLATTPGISNNVQHGPEFEAQLQAVQQDAENARLIQEEQEARARLAAETAAKEEADRLAAEAVAKERSDALAKSKIYHAKKFKEAEEILGPVDNRLLHAMCEVITTIDEFSNTEKQMKDVYLKDQANQANYKTWAAEITRISIEFSSKLRLNALGNIPSEFNSPAAYRDGTREILEKLHAYKLVVREKVQSRLNGFLRSFLSTPEEQEALRTSSIDFEAAIENFTQTTPWKRETNAETASLVLNEASLVSQREDAQRRQAQLYLTLMQQVEELESIHTNRESRAKHHGTYASDLHQLTIENFVDKLTALNNTTGVNLNMVAPEHKKFFADFYLKSNHPLAPKNIGLEQEALTKTVIQFLDILRKEANRIRNFEKK